MDGWMDSGIARLRSGDVYRSVREHTRMDARYAGCHFQVTAIGG